MALAWTQRREALLSDCIVSPDVFTPYSQNIRTRFPTGSYTPYHRPDFDLFSAPPSPHTQRRYGR
jgi:hypothetical protein